MKVNRIFAVIMAVCVMGFGVPYVNTFTENKSVMTASAVGEVDYTEGTYGQLTYKNYGDYIEISDCDKTAETIVIPAEIDGVPVTSIRRSAFSYCSSLTSIKISDSVTSIGAWAFDSCKSLTSIELPYGITSIDGLFADCSSLTSIKIPDTVTSIEDSTFFGCTALQSITIPDSVTSIAEFAFLGCTNLQSITIPENVTYIGGATFGVCRNLKEITILNPKCEIREVTFLTPEGEIYDDDITISNGYNEKTKEYYFDGIIYGYENSTAQAYAEKYGYKFELIGTEPEVITGDLNGDKSINIADAVLLQSYILEKQELTEEQYKNADINGDGYVDSFDMVLLRRMIIENNK